MKRIILIDSWSNGSKFFSPLVADLKKSYEIIFIHNDKKYLNKKIENLSSYHKVFDISDFNNSFYSCIKELNPSLVMFISMHGILHRRANAICQYLDIPVFFFPHGVRLENNITQSKSIFHKMNRAIFYFEEWIQATKEMFQIGFFRSKEMFLTFFEFYLNNKKFSNNPSTNWGLNFNTIFLNYSSEKKYFTRFFNIPSDSKTRFITSGNVLADSCLNKSKIKSRNINNNKILFISQPLHSWVGFPKTSYIEFIELLKKKLESRQFDLVVRLHPNDDNYFKEHLKNSGIEISNNKNYSDDLYSYNRFIGVCSAAMLAPIKIKLPTLSITLKDVPSFADIDGFKNYLQYSIDDLDMAIDSLLDLKISNNDEIFHMPASKIIIDNVKNFLR